MHKTVRFPLGSPSLLEFTFHAHQGQVDAVRCNPDRFTLGLCPQHEMHLNGWELIQLGFLDRPIGEAGIDNVAIGDQENPAPILVQNTARADGSSTHFEQNGGPHGPVEVRGHALQGGRVGLKVGKVHGQRLRGIDPGQQNDPDDHIRQAQENGGRGENDAALLGSLHAGKGQAAQQDGDRSRHSAEKGDAGQGGQESGQGQAIPARRQRGRPNGTGRGCGSSRQRDGVANFFRRDLPGTVPVSRYVNVGRSAGVGTTLALLLPTAAMMHRPAGPADG